MKTKSVTMEYNICHSCIHNNWDIGTCVFFNNCHSWEEFYNKDGSLKDDDNYIFIDNGVNIIGKIKVIDIEQILKERAN